MERRRILMVDDDEAIRESYSAALEREGYEVVTADSAFEAVRATRLKGIELIILDLQLSQRPLGQGLAVLCHLWEDPTFNIPVIIHSGYVDSPGFEGELTRIERDYGRGRRVYESLRKSNEPDRLIHAARSILNEIAASRNAQKELEKDLTVLDDRLNYLPPNGDFADSLDEFHQVCEERIADALTKLRERREAEHYDPGLINDLFLHAHNIKGEAAMLGISALSTFCHKIEGILDDARKEKKPFRETHVHLLEESLETLSKLNHVARGEAADYAGEPLSIGSVLQEAKTQYLRLDRLAKTS